VNPPPFLVSFPDKASFKASLAVDVLALYWSDIERLIDQGLPPAVSVRVVATLFGFSSKFIGALIRKPERHYRTFVIRKGKKRREIHAPKVGLKVIQKWLSWHLDQTLKFDDEVYGFVPGRSAPMAATVHCGARWVYSLDIADFFPTTTAQKVTSALQGAGYPDHAAAFVSALCCYGGNLAQGSPASPVLSNLVFRPSDVELKRIAAETASRYTRYADDIVFSGLGDPPSGLAERVRSVIEEAGWKVANRKERLTQLPQRLKVHGLLVHGSTPRLTKGYRNRIRAITHLLRHDKVNDKDIALFRGHLSYAKSVEKLSKL
jgi:RNA-directed DNA polymerase